MNLLWLVAAALAGLAFHAGWTGHPARGLIFFTLFVVAVYALSTQVMARR